MRPLAQRACLAMALVLVTCFVLGSNANAQFRVGSIPVEPKTQEFVPGEILVRFQESAPEGFSQTVHDAFGCHVIYQSPFAGFQRVAIPVNTLEVDMAKLYSMLPHVEYAELNTVCHAHGVPNDPFYAFQWHMPQINMPAAWDTSTGSGVIVAILDSGVAYENYPVPSWELNTVANGVTSYVQAPDLANTSFVPGYDFINNDAHPNDNNSHGSHVAGTVAQSTNNGVGVAGVAYNASIMPVKVLNYQGSGSASALADGLYFCANNGAQVANMSLGWNPGYNPGSTVSNAIAYAYNAGVTLVASAGNAGSGTVSYPALYSQVIAVGAVRYDAQRSYYSQYGTGLEIMAPGGDVTIDQDGDGYVDGVLQNTIVGYSSENSKANPTSFGYYFFQGTSMASPHIAGVAALVIANGVTGVENVRAKLTSTATDLGASGYDTGYGWGLVNAEAALAGGGGGGDTTAPTPDPMSFSSPPSSSGTSSISMTASTATDSSGGVEYYFDALTAGANDSGWQSSTSYTDTGLSPNTTYSYRVKARDVSANQNETAYSGSASATTDPSGGGGPVELAYDDFESGWGNYSDGGSDCSRYTGGTHSYQGSASIDIQDNSGIASSFTLTNGIDLASPGYTQLTIEFTFKAVSMENGEDFWVQYFDGSSWLTVASYARGVNFNNNTFYSATVTLNESSVNFPSNMKVRFRCDASANADDVYIDTIRLTAQ